MLRLATATFVIALVAAPYLGMAQIQSVCGDRTELIKDLDRKYQEKPQAIGILADGGLLEVLVSPDGSWTILVTYPKQQACVVAVGEDWQDHIRLVGEGI